MPSLVLLTDDAARGRHLEERSLYRQSRLPEDYECGQANPS